MKRASRRVDASEIAALLHDEDYSSNVPKVEPGHAATMVCETIAEIGVACMAMHRLDDPRAEDIALLLFNLRLRLKGVHEAMTR